VLGLEAAYRLAVVFAVWAATATTLGTIDRLLPSLSATGGGETWTLASLVHVLGYLLVVEASGLLLLLAAILLKWTFLAPHAVNVLTRSHIYINRGHRYLTPAMTLDLESIVLSLSVYPFLSLTHTVTPHALLRCPGRPCPRCASSTRAFTHVHSACRPATFVWTLK
jgi:hypothetical protein